MPRGLKSIFGREKKNNFSTKNGPGRSKIDFWSKNQKLHFLIKICPKMVLRGLKSIFGRKMKISNFRPKMDPGDQKPIFS